ncbi:MAG: hypothetical protein OXI83_03865, partial [Gemmatimonadota bacterium]|nr:hypothetical protein [Gemmatimonadota bacterium]
MSNRNSPSWQLIDSILSASEAIVALGITLEDLGEDTCVLRMPKQAELTRGDGTMYHGGPVASLI